MGDGRIKLNCGSFTTMFHHGWINIDIHPLQEWGKAYGYIYKQYDLKTVPYDNNTVDLAYCCHMLEHLSYNDGQRFLNECYRVMKPGAVLRLLLPDPRVLIQKYLDGTLGDFDELNDGCASTPNQIAKFWTLLFSGHQSSYDFITLESALKKAGFDQIVQVGFRKSVSKQIMIETIDMYPDLSLFVEVIK